MKSTRRKKKTLFEIKFLLCLLQIILKNNVPISWLISNISVIVWHYIISYESGMGDEDESIHTRAASRCAGNSWNPFIITAGSSSDLLLHEYWPKCTVNAHLSIIALTPPPTRRSRRLRPASVATRSEKRASSIRGSCLRSDAGVQTGPLPLRCKRRLKHQQNTTALRNYT